MLVSRISLVCLVAGLALVLGGCTPTIIGTDAGVYSHGRLYAVATGDITSVYEATLAAFKKLEIDVTEKAKDVFYAKVVAMGADGKTTIVRIEPAGDNTTNISIRVSPLGNEARSAAIYQQIKQSLIATK